MKKKITLILETGAYGGDVDRHIARWLNDLTNNNRNLWTNILFVIL